MGISLNVKPAAETTTEAQEVSVQTTEATGSKSSSIAFIANLGNPAREDTITRVGENGEKETIVKAYVVGYRLKNVGDEPIKVPNFGTTDAFSHNNLMDAGDLTKFRTVKPGEEFDLTRYEIGVLGSDEIYNCEFTGGEIPVHLTFTRGSKGAKGAEASIATTSASPTVSLSRKGSGSLKDCPYVMVLNVNEIINEDGSKTKELVINEGFEKFAPLTKRSTTAGSKGKKAAATQRNKNAVKFLALHNSLVAARSKK